MIGLEPVWVQIPAGPLCVNCLKNAKSNLPFTNSALKPEETDVEPIYILDFTFLSIETLRYQIKNRERVKFYPARATSNPNGIEIYVDTHRSTIISAREALMM
jgi:hypothetical protein